MKKLHYEIMIDAPADKVYRLMLEDASYRKWTAPFKEGSYYEGSWNKGNKILFLAPHEGSMGGMVSEINENIPNKFVSVRHLGMVQNGEEITSGPMVDPWAGALEEYTFEPKGSRTLLQVDLDNDFGMETYFNEAWAKALDILKALCETA